MEETVLTVLAARWNGTLAFAIGALQTRAAATPTAATAVMVAAHAALDTLAQRATAVTQASWDTQPASTIRASQIRATVTPTAVTSSLMQQGVAPTQHANAARGTGLQIMVRLTHEILKFHIDAPCVGDT